MINVNRSHIHRKKENGIILKSNQGLGDIVCLTAIVRDFKLANPQYIIDCRTSYQPIWKNNPNVDKSQIRLKTNEQFKIEWASHHKNSEPTHLIEKFKTSLESQLRVNIPLTRLAGDLYLTEQEKQNKYGDYWVIMGGGKYDHTAKWWVPQFYQDVVDQAGVKFVQCGEARGQWHNPLKGVVNLLGKTSIRDFLGVIYNAKGVVGPVTAAVHIAAAFNKPAVVIAGGRELPAVARYPGHAFLHTLGQLPCCMTNGCWLSKCQDGDGNMGNNSCGFPVQINPGLKIPKCMTMITPEMVVKAIHTFTNPAN